MRVLIVKMSSLGDIIHTLPAVTDAAKALPGISFDWVAEEAFVEIPAWHPAVDTVIPVALRRWRKSPIKEFTGPEWRQCRTALRRHHYDAVIDAQGLLKSALISRLVPAPRYGMDRNSARESLSAMAYHHKIPVPVDLHAVDRTRLLFARALQYKVPAEMGDYGVRGNLQTSVDRGNPGLLFFHGTARAEKLWPVERWIELAKLAESAGYTVWLPWGSDREKQRAEEIAGRVDRAQVLPKLNLLGLASLLLEVDGAVAVDTGLGHLAAALDVPQVSLYGPTKTALIGAYGNNQVHIQSPVGPQQTDDVAAMMNSIESSEVWDRLIGILPGCPAP